MSNLFLSLFISGLLIIITTMLYYEILRYTWKYLPSLTIALRQRILVVIIAIFGGHTLAVWIYAVAYWLLDNYTTFGSIEGNLVHNFVDYLYFSASTYSSLGLGDIYPLGEFRIMASVEVLNGLVLIGWSASFLYLVMQNFWDMHGKK